MSRLSWVRSPFVYLGLWFLMQVSSGLLDLGAAGAFSGIAWWAHIGGFAFGALTALRFLRPVRRAPPPPPDGGFLPLSRWGGPTQSTEPVNVLPSTVSPSSSESSRFRMWLRRALRWSTELQVVFAMGLGATWLAQVRPLQLQVEALEQERATLEAQVADLKLQVDAMEALRAENVSLVVDQARLEQQRLDLQEFHALHGAGAACAGGPTGRWSARACLPPQVGNSRMDFVFGNARYVGEVPA